MKENTRANNKYYSNKYLGDFYWGEKKITNNIHYEQLLDLTPENTPINNNDYVSYSVNYNYDNKSLTVLGSDNSSMTVNRKYDIINWFVNESTLTFREVDRSTNEQYDRTINIVNGETVGSRRVLLEERDQEFVNPKVMENNEGSKGKESASVQLDRSVRRLSFKNVSLSAADPEFSTSDSTFDINGATALLTTVQPSPDNPPTGYEGSNRHRACLRGLAIKVDGRGNIASSAVHATDKTTNNLNLITLLQNAGIAPTTKGSYSYIFEFFGWYTKGKPAGTPGSPGTGHKWLSDDTMYKIYEGYHGPLAGSK